MRTVTQEDVDAARAIVIRTYRGLDYEGEAMLGLTAAAMEWDPDRSEHPELAWKALRAWRVLERARAAFRRDLNKPAMMSLDAPVMTMRGEKPLHETVGRDERQPDIETIDELEFMVSLVSGTKRRALAHCVWVLGMSLNDAALRVGATTKSADSLISQAYSQVRDRILHRRSDLRHWRYRAGNAGDPGKRARRPAHGRTA